MTKLKILLSLLFLTVGLSLSRPAYAYPKQIFGPQTSADVVAEVNSLRATYGLPPYQENSTLMAIAQIHAQYMASTGVVSHYGADGSRPYQRALAAGYQVAGDLSQGGFFSENIQSGADLSAADVVKAWQGDSPHLTTMISADLQDIGVGVAVANGVTYYTLDAGQSKAATEISSSPSPSGSDPFSHASATPTGAVLVVTSTPLEDGTVYHIVQEKEALWSIALAYHTSVAELKKLNKLATDQIFVGQKLTISKKVVDTPTPEPTITVTLGIPTSTATLPVTPPPTITATPIPKPPSSRKNGGLIVGGIVLVALLSAGIGAWVGRKKSAIE